MYATAEDLLKRVSPEAILGAADFEGSGDLNAAPIKERIEAAICDASAVVDAYVRRRRPVPLYPVPDVIRRVTADMAIYNLFGLRGFDEDGPDKDVIRRQKSAINFLEQVAKGLILIGTDEPPKAGEIRIQGPARIFGRDKMRGF